MSPALPSSPPEKGGENGGDGEEKVMGGALGPGSGTSVLPDQEA